MSIMVNIGALLLLLVGAKWSLREIDESPSTMRMEV